MRKLFTVFGMAVLAMLLMLRLSGAVFSADLVVEWRQSVGADGYKIETSQDAGATWIEVPSFTFTSFVLLNEITQETRNMATATVTVPDNILVIARIGAYNSGGTSWRLESGAWHNSSWAPLPASTGLGVQ